MNWFHIIFVCEIYIILALSTNLVSGYTGQLSFASASFFGVGAYVTAILMKNWDMGFGQALLAAMATNFMVSLVLTYCALRLRDLYFVLSTIAFQIIAYSILYNWENVTGGSHGLPDIPDPVLFGNRLSESSDFALLGGFFALIVILFFWLLQRTPFVRLLECIRDREIGAVTLGKDISYYKFVCISLSASLMAIAGGLFAVNSGYLDASSFGLSESILIVSMILIGGTGNLVGPVFGACFYVLLPEFTRLVPISSAQGANVQMIIYAIVLIFVVRFKPNGVFGKYKFE